MAPPDPTTLLGLLQAAGDALLEVSDDGSVRRAGDEERTTLAELVHADDLARVQQELATPGDATTVGFRSLPDDEGRCRHLTWVSRREDGRWLCLERDAEREAQLRDAQENAQLGHWEYDPAAEVLYPSQLLRSRLDLRGERPGIALADFLELVPESDRERARTAIADAVRDGTPFEAEWPLRTGDTVEWFAVRARPVHDAERRLRALHGMAQNITARKQSELAATFRASLLDHIDAAVVATDLDGRVTHWNAGAERQYGWTAEEMLGERAAPRAIPPEERDLAALAFDELRSTGRFEGELTVRRKDGTTFPAHLSNALLYDEQGEPTGIVGVTVDVAERRRAAEAAAHTRDFLTAITDHMAEGLYTVDHKGRLTYLNPAAERMLGWRGEDLRGRYVHDLIHHTRANGDPHPREECPMVKVLREHTPVRVEDDVFIRRNGSKLPVSYSSAPLHTVDGVVGSVVVFSDISERKAEQLRLLREIDELAWVGRVQDALREERFVLHAQPIVELRSRSVVSHELLIRMRHDGGLIAPNDFLPTAEKYGLIENIDRWVIWEAARIAGQGSPVQLNLSAETAGSPDLLEIFEAALDAAGADPRDMVVEITETALMKGDAAEELVRGLRSMGLRLALDDFGTGYGGFTYLKKLPVHFLKIDREFVRDLRRDRASRHVVEAVVTLARGFGQKTIAEGVEDAETLAILGELGVDYAQGYFLGRPIPADEALASREA